MTTAGVIEIRSNNSSEEEDPRPIELPGVGSEKYGCGLSCWYLLSWVVSLILYTVETFVTIWAAYTYATSSMYIPFGISLAYLAIPQVILVTLSLTWYYNLDRYHRKRRECDPHNLEFIEYRKKFTAGAIVFHVVLLGMIYRYSQLIYLVMIRKLVNIRFLRRDTILLRLVHSLCVSAPLIIVHLYVLSLSLPTCLNPESTSQCNVLEFPSLYAALGSSLATLLYSVLAFATNDRLSSNHRRVVLPAHLTQILWYTCMIASRMLAILMFAFVYHFYIFAFIGGHWLVMFVFLLIQRTTVCADVIRESDSRVKIKRRWCLELSFDFVAATMYIFAFFNFRRGNTRYWGTFYHLLMYAEIATMSALFYIEASPVPYHYVFSLTSLTLAVGLYPVGLLFMFCYYLFFHPKKTEHWHWIGVPKRRSRSENLTGGFRNRTPMPEGRVAISGPTLVAHNGFIPRNMLPDNLPSSPGHENGMVTDPTEIILQSQQRSEQIEQIDTGSHHDWIVPGNRVSNERDMVTSLTMVSPNSTSKTKSSPVMSDGHSALEPSEVDTDISSGVLHVPQGEIKGDTIIDTPLFGNTPDPMQQLRLTTTEIEAPTGTLRSLTDTVDTGIDLGADTPLTQGTNDPQDNGEFNGNEAGLYSRAREDVSLGLDIDLPQFSDIPAKRNSFIAKKSPLESHYFPDSRSHESLTPTLPAPTWGYKTPGSTRPPLGQNSSGESGEVYQSRKKPSTQSNHHVLPLAMSTPERTRRSAPRSPKGARAFTITPGDEGKPAVLTRNRVGHTSSYPNPSESYRHHSPPRLRAPRSPKGARRMLITQPDTSTKQRPEPIELQPSNRHSFTSSTFYQSKSPERAPTRGVLNYQRTPAAALTKTPDGRRRNIARPASVQKSNSIHGPPSMRSPERLPGRGYRREVAPSTQQRQYIQQQQQNRSRWDKWAAEQEEKRRQANSEAKQRVAVTQSYPSAPNHMRYKSEEFDHLEPISEPKPVDMTDTAPSMHNSASIAPQGYPRAPQGARGSTPRVGWSPGRSDRISLSPQRSIHSMPGASLLQQDKAAMSASTHISHTPRTHIRLSEQLSGGSFNKFYPPMSSMHQSAV